MSNHVLILFFLTFEICLFKYSPSKAYKRNKIVSSFRRISNLFKNKKLSILRYEFVNLEFAIVHKMYKKLSHNQIFSIF